METIRFKFSESRSLIFPRAHLRWVQLEDAGSVTLNFTTQTIKLRRRKISELFVGLLNGGVSEVVRVGPQHVAAAHEVTAVILMRRIPASPKPTLLSAAK